MGVFGRCLYWFLWCVLCTNQMIFAASTAAKPVRSLNPASFSAWSNANKAMDKKLILALVDKVVATSAPLPVTPPASTGFLSSMMQPAPVTLDSLKRAVTSAWSDSARWEAAANCIVRAVASSLNAKAEGKKGSSGLSESEKNVDTTILGSICAKAIAQIKDGYPNKDKAISQQSTAQGSSAQKLDGFARCISYALGTGVAGAYVAPLPTATTGTMGGPPGAVPGAAPPGGAMGMMAGMMSGRAKSGGAIGRAPM